MRTNTYVRSDTIVPEDHGAGLPPNASLVVKTPVDMIVEEVEDGLW